MNDEEFEALCQRNPESEALFRHQRRMEQIAVAAGIDVTKAWSPDDATKRAIAALEKHGH